MTRVNTTGTDLSIEAVSMTDGSKRRFIFNNLLNTIRDEEGNFLREPKRESVDVNTFGENEPLGKINKVRVLKISLGLSCNFECSYCSQRFVPHSDETNAKDIDAFLEKLLPNIAGVPEKVEFWGGEPFVYWKTFKPLAERVRFFWPNAQFSVITNGSLLDEAKIEWLDALNFQVAISHDGPGQKVRGPDPLQDADTADAILKLYGRLRPQGRISFNAMLNSENMSRKAVQDFFIAFTGDPTVPIGEGSMITPYDEGGLASSVPDESGITFRKTAFNEIRLAEDSNCSITRQRITSWFGRFEQQQADSFKTACGVTASDNLTVDLHGNVLTCQNVSAVSIAPNAQPHVGGDIQNLSAVEIKTMTYWHERTACRKCPVVSECRGTCPFIENELRWVGCDNAFNDQIAHFAAAFESFTGYIPTRIRPLDESVSYPEYRASLWDYVPKENKRKFIPINAV